MAGQVLDKSQQFECREKGNLKRFCLAFWLYAVWVIFSFGVHINQAVAGTSVALRESFAGNMSFELTGGSFRTTQNNTSACTFGSSSSGSMSSLPVGATIEKAYLYWAASAQNSSYMDNQVKLNGINVYADRLYTEYTGSWYFYSGVADVTSLIQTYGNSTYTVTELNMYSSYSHCQSQTMLGGWALMVIFSDDDEDFRVLNVYEGFQSFQHNSVTLIPNNFKLPSNPSGKHAHITWEGDDTLGTDGEYLSFEGNLLTDSNNPSNNQFNSYSNVQGGFNSYGVDIDEYDISAYLVEGATQVSTTYSAGQDLVLLSAEIVSVSNIPVADLSVTTSNPTGWQQGSTVTKKFTVSNNGPNDVPAQSVEFTTTLPAQLSFSGTQGDSDWSCSQSGQTLTCRYQPKLRSGWSDYIDLRFNVANNSAPSTANLSVSVNHDNAPYDIFDNHAENDTYQFNVPIVTTPVVDLSASSKTYTNLSGDLLLAGDTLRYVITIDDASDLAVSGARVTDDLPANISGYSILSFPSGATNNSIPSGGANGTGYMDISNISLAAGATEEIILEVYVSATAPVGASLQNTADITYNSNSWTVDTGDITVVKPDLSDSIKTAGDVNAGWLLPGESALYSITIDDADDLELSGIRLQDHLPANISSFNIISLPAGATDYSVIGGGNNGTGFVDIRDIYLAAGDTVTIQIEVIVADDATDGASLQNTATLSVNSASWDIASNDLVVTLSDNTPASGNKPLYLVNSTLTRLLPSTDTSRSFRHGDTLTWTLDRNLLTDLTLNAGDMDFNLAITGHRTGGVQTRFDTQLYYNDNNGSGDILLTSSLSDYGNYRINTDYNVPITLNLAAAQTLPAGSSLILRIYNQSSNNNSNSYSQIDVHSINPSNGARSALTLNAATVINVDAITVWDATFGDPNGTGAGNQVANSQPDTDLFIRAIVSDPFGAFDITDADISITKANGTAYDFSSHPDGNQNQMNQVDTTSDDVTTATKTYEKQITLLETGESTGWWTISITAYEGMESAPDQVVHTRGTSFKIRPFQPVITLDKSIVVLNDPVNGITNPKAIPGAELKYSILSKNSGRGSTANGSMYLTDEVPENSELFIGDISCAGNAGPACFTDGTTPNHSGLSFTFINITDVTDNLEFSTDGSDYSYVPDDADGDGYDPAIRYIRLKPQGSFRASDKNVTYEPEFTFEYQIKLQ